MRKYAIKFPKEGLTKQSFKDECDINKIMARFQKTGAMDHFAKHSPQYGDATPIEYQDALNVVANANTMFEELPATIRDKFENDPTQFLEFVQDERNEAEMIELGLKKAAIPSVPSAATAEQAVKAPDGNAATAEDNSES